MQLKLDWAQFQSLIFILFLRQKMLLPML